MNSLNHFTRLSGVPVIGEVFNSLKMVVVQKELAGLIPLLILLASACYTYTNPETFTYLADGIEQKLGNDAYCKMLVRELSFPISVIAAIVAISLIVRFFSPSVEGVMSGENPKGVCFWILKSGAIFIPLYLVYEATLSPAPFGETLALLAIFYILICKPIVTSVFATALWLIAILRFMLESAVSSQKSHGVVSKLLVAFCVMSALWLEWRLLELAFEYDSSQDVFSSYTIITFFVCVFFHKAIYQDSEQVKVRKMGLITTRSFFVPYFYTTSQTVYKNKSAEERKEIRDDINASLLTLGSNFTLGLLLAFVVQGFPHMSGWAVLGSLVFVLSMVFFCCGFINRWSTEEYHQGKFGVGCCLRVYMSIAPLFFMVSLCISGWQLVTS